MGKKCYKTSLKFTEITRMGPEKVEALDQSEAVQRLLEKDSVSTLAEFDCLQGYEIATQEEAQKIATLQKEFVQSALREGFEKLAECEGGNADISLRRLERVFSCIYQYFNAVRMFPQTPRGSMGYLQVADFSVKIYETIHSTDGLSDRERLFCEFLVGLGNFDLATEMGAETIERLLGKYESEAEENDREKFTFAKADVARLKASLGGRGGMRILDGLQAVDAAAFELGNIIVNLFKENHEDFWLKLERTIAEDKYMQAAAKRLVSMRYIPKNQRFLGAAQSLHWGGFGNDAAWIAEHPELAFLSRHGIGFMDGSQGQTNFCARMALFSKAIMPLKERAFKVGAACLEDAFPGQNEFKIFDSCSGLGAKGIAGIGKYLGGKHVDLTIGDVAGKTLAETYPKKGERDENGVMIEGAEYQDLSLPLDGSKHRDKFDMYSAAIGEHQLTDGELGLDNLKNLFRFGTEIVHDGGFISFPDAGGKVYIQYPVIPSNLVDREGRLPENMYASGVSFTDVAVRTRQGFYKIPYRLSALRYATPEKLAERTDAGIYEYNIFKVVEIPKSTLQLLETARKTEDFQRCDEIMRQHFDIKSVQKRVRAKIGL